MKYYGGGHKIAATTYFNSVVQAFIESFEYNYTGTNFFNVTGVRCEFLPTPEKAAACKSNPLGAPFPRLWEPLPESFDTFSNALLTMFELVSGENWPVLFWQMVDGLSGRGVNDFGGRGWMPGDPPNPLWAAIAYHMFIQTIMNQVILELFSGAILCRKAS